MPTVSEAEERGQLPSQDKAQSAWQFHKGEKENEKSKE
jgi:hypothetical protein